MVKNSVAKNVTHLVATEEEYAGAKKPHAKMVADAAALDTCIVVQPEWVERTFEAKHVRDHRDHQLDLR